MHIINLRKHYPHYTEDIFIEVSDEVYEEITMQKVSMEQLYQALHALPPQQARRVYQRYINQKKNVEIARAEGVHETSTRQSLIKAIENLRKYYAKNGWLL